MSKINSIHIQKEIGISSWFCFGVIFYGPRDLLLKKLKENNIEYRPIVSGNFTKNFAIKYFMHRIFGKLTNSDLIHYNGISFGNSHLNLKKQIDLLAKVLNSIKV